VALVVGALAIYEGKATLADVKTELAKVEAEIKAAAGTVSSDFSNGAAKVIARLKAVL
jgi:hypothetical protein